MRILFLQKRSLFPTNTGGKIRTLNVLRHLAKWHDVTYLCNVLPEEEPHLDCMRELGVRLETIPWTESSRGSLAFYGELFVNLFSPYPYNVAKDYDFRLRRRAEELINEDSYDLLICDFVQMARNAIGLPGPPKLLFQHNVEAEIFERHARTDRGWVRRKYMALQWRKMYQFESSAGKQFDTVVAVSDRDKQIYHDSYGWTHTRTIDTAVDTEYFQPSERCEIPGRVLFVGSMDWLPNHDGVKWFSHEVWPRVRSNCQDAVFQIVGRNPGSEIKNLGALDGVEVVGTVPDVRPYLQEASVVVVPLLVGGGTRIKIFEAMAMQKAVVSTSIGAEGLDVTANEHIEVADQPDVFAARVADLLSDSSKRRRLGTNAGNLVAREFSAEKVARQFEQICMDTVQRTIPVSVKD